LVTLTGPGGVGKTRLALAVGERLRGRFGAGTAFVPLAAATRPEQVVAGIGRAVGADLAGAHAPLEVLVEQFGDGAWLLVLDNLETGRWRSGRTGHFGASARASGSSASRPTRATWPPPSAGTSPTTPCRCRTCSGSCGPSGSCGTICLSLIAFARLALVEGDHDRAALLTGAADGLRRRVGVRVWPMLRQGEADLVDQVRQALGADRFDEVLAAGARLTQREAVAAARDRRGAGATAA
jgi:hypothetical protein